jgi:2-oxo-hept-3-ene-1,7-dioate hydratase
LTRPAACWRSITEPDHGVIFGDMVFADGGVVPFGRFIRPRVEVELAFVLDRPQT